jgi:hypothetical protein
MNFIALAISGILLFAIQMNTSEKVPLCTCLSYELKDQLEVQEIVSHAKVIKIDTVRISQSNWCQDAEMRKALYQRKESMLKVTFKNKVCLKGVLKSDTFSVISLNYCQFTFNDNSEYMIAARQGDFCELQILNDSVKCKPLSILCTHDCSGNSIYYEGVEKRYVESLK